MIIARTPFRISFFGGGTDYPVWYRENGGSVISTSIDKYCYITCRYMPPFFDFKHRIRYYQKEEVSSLEEIKHASVRECLRFMGVSEGIEMVHNADLPAQSGLGSSSTFSVGMLHALYALKNKMPTKRELALNAIHVEQEMIKENVGSQDQAAAAFGGFNRIFFGGPQELRVEQILMPPLRLRTLQDNLMIFFTGFSRSASDIAGEQIRKTIDKHAELMEMMQLTDEAFNILRDESTSLDEFGRLLHKQWVIKRGITDLISNSAIDEIYATGIKAGALGGKLLGAGGGGFILFYAKPQDQDRLKESLNGYLHVPFHFEHLGSQIIYHSG
jgi:D-glycero-alpha-D-manno-heptose-7-phosphate kinase